MCGHHNVYFSYMQQQIRVFIFLAGPGHNDHLKQIACDNGGIDACRKVLLSSAKFVLSYAGRIYEVNGYNDILNHTQVSGLHAPLLTLCIADFGHRHL